MQDISSASLVTVFLLLFTRAHSKEQQSKHSTSACKVRKVKVISLQTKVLFEKLTFQLVRGEFSGRLGNQDIRRKQ